MAPKYLIDGTVVDPVAAAEVNGSFPRLTEQRPTGEMFRAIGRGEYRTYRPDGQAIRSYVIRLNRKGTLSIDNIKASGLEALSTINLERLTKRFEAIVKIWPEGARAQLRKVEAELARRADLVDRATAHGVAS